MEALGAECDSHPGTMEAAAAAAAAAAASGCFFFFNLEFPCDKKKALSPRSHGATSRYEERRPGKWRSGALPAGARAARTGAGAPPAGLPPALPGAPAGRAPPPTSSRGVRSGRDAACPVSRGAAGRLPGTVFARFVIPEEGAPVLVHVCLVSGCPSGRGGLIYWFTYNVCFILLTRRSGVHGARRVPCEGGETKVLPPPRHPPPLPTAH